MGNKARAERPHMPGYGVDESLEGLLPWSWAEERLARSRNFWLSTQRRDGRPHSMPVWAVWVDGGLYFSTGEATMKARNLSRSAECVVTTEQADEPVVIEGIAERVAADIAEVVQTYTKKHGMPYPPTPPSTGSSPAWHLASSRNRADFRRVRPAGSLLEHDVRDS